MDFTTNLQAYQTKYYSQAIINFAYIYSALYLEKEYKNQTVLKSRLNSLLDKDTTEFPIAKDRTQVQQ